MIIEHFIWMKIRLLKVAPTMHIHRITKFEAITMKHPDGTQRTYARTTAHFFFFFICVSDIAASSSESYEKDKCKYRT